MPPRTRAAALVPELTLAEIEELDREDLIKWIQRRYPKLLDASDLRLFKAIKLSGKVFIRQDSVCFKECGIAVGVSQELELIIRTIQRRAGKRKGDFDNERESSKRFFPDTSKVYEDLHEAASKVSLDVAKYCNISEVQTLPLLFAGQVPTDRFHLDQNRHFEFYGRKIFRNVYDAAKAMNILTSRRLFLHGTLGAGKSHLLAALTCVLRKEGVRVVYLPDCRALLDNPFRYLRHALRLAFFEQQEIQAFFLACEKIEQLVEFCNNAASAHQHILFIIDQVNALDPQDEARDRYSNETKRLARTLLENITSEHLKLSSSTGNYMHAAYDTHRQTNEKRISIYGGLGKSEMKTWWQANQARLPLKFNEEDEKEIETLTGKIPIFLHVLLTINLPSLGKDGDSSDSEGEEDLGDQTEAEVYADNVHRVIESLWESKEVQDSIASLIDFAVARSRLLRDTDDLLMFRQAISTCLTGGSVGLGKEKLLDWRYFYVIHGNGYAVSGIVREASARFLRSTMGADEFLSQRWYDSLRMAGKNPSMLGFFTETMLLSWISVNGCSAAGPEFQERPKTFMFDDARPTVNRESSLSLHIPVAFNYTAVDAILVAVDKQKDVATITGVQITISKTHSDSEAKFFADWERWRDIVDCATVYYRFLWVMEDVGQNSPTESIKAGKRLLRGKPKVWFPDFQRRYASVKEVSMDIGRKLEDARKSARSI